MNLVKTMKNPNYGPDAEMIASMNYRFACLGETCDKMFVKWKPCKKHILVCCGIASNQQNSKELIQCSSLKAKKQGAQYRKGGKKKGLLPQPSEQDLVQTVEQYYDYLHDPVNRKHVLGHIRKLYVRESSEGLDLDLSLCFPRGME